MSKPESKSYIPKPCLIYGHYTLADGSIIYPSGSKSREVKPGKFFVWVHDGWVIDSQSRRVPDGHVLLDRSGIRYFDSPGEATAAAIREKASK